MASTDGNGFWIGLRDQLAGVAVDYARAKWVDVETAADDRNMPDLTDLRYDGSRGQGSGTGLVRAPGGIPWVGWLALGAAVIVGAVLLKRHA